jgi:molybdopterin converting factor small subunit
MTWDASKYFAKAKRYWSKASSVPRDDDQFLLHVSFFCEFFIRGVLVFKSPVLNADLSEESLLHAAGVDGFENAKSIGLRTAITRLKAAYPDLKAVNLDPIQVLVDARNRELHGENDEISTQDSTQILPAVYLLAVKGAEATKFDLVDLMGTEDADAALEAAKAVQKDRSHRVKSDMKNARDRFYERPSEEQVELRKKEASFGYAVQTNGTHLKSHKCPACGSQAVLGGKPIGVSREFLRDGSVMYESRAVPTVFSCDVCGLKLSGLAELMAAGLPHEITTLDERDPVEFFNVDPMDYVDTSEIIREYGEEMHGYQDE